MAIERNRDGLREIEVVLSKKQRSTTETREVMIFGQGTRQIEFQTVQRVYCAYSYRGRCNNVTDQDLLLEIGYTTLRIPLCTVHMAAIARQTMPFQTYSDVLLVALDLMSGNGLFEPAEPESPAPDPNETTRVILDDVDL